MSSIYATPGGDGMTVEAKVILVALADIAGKAKYAKTVYKAIAKMASVEGIELKTYEEAQAEKEEDEAE